MGQGFFLFYMQVFFYKKRDGTWIFPVLYASFFYKKRDGKWIFPVLYASFFL
jgi:hypothetical protein